MNALSAWDLFIDFAEVPFAVPEVADADGLLYQFGTYAFTGEPTFYLDLVRQFAVFGSDEYVQIHLELQFEPSDDLAALGQHSEWFWLDGRGVVRDWSRHVQQRPEWRILDDRTPNEVRVYQDET
jgi:hypothetical protein